MHYVLDAYIWRFDGSNPGLREYLLGAPPAKVHQGTPNAKSAPPGDTTQGTPTAGLHVGGMGPRRHASAAGAARAA